MTDSEQKFRPLNSVAILNWRFKLVTPMLIRSPENTYWTHSPLDRKDDKKTMGKSRGIDMRINIKAEKKPTDAYAELGLPFFRYEIIEGKLERKYHIPVSSIRGAMRSWTIHNLVDQKDWGDSSKYGTYINSLFGNANESSDSESEVNGQAGRLRFFGGEIKTPGKTEPDIQGNWDENYDSQFDFNNAPRHIKIRNPIDRITMASKEHGLHSFIEFSPGMEFDVKIELREPQERDLVFMATIKEEIKSGMLRFGALSSVGRGRVEVIADLSKKRSLRKPLELPETSESKDVLDFLFDCERIILDDEYKKRNEVNFHD